MLQSAMTRVRVEDSFRSDHQEKLLEEMAFEQRPEGLAEAGHEQIGIKSISGRGKSK